MKINIFYPIFKKEKEKEKARPSVPYVVSHHLVGDFFLTHSAMVFLRPVAHTPSLSFLPSPHQPLTFLSSTLGMPSFPFFLIPSHKAASPFLGLRHQLSTHPVLSYPRSSGWPTAIRLVLVSDSFSLSLTKSKLIQYIDDLLLCSPS